MRALRHRGCSSKSPAYFVVAHAHSSFNSVHGRMRFRGNRCCAGQQDRAGARHVSLATATPRPSAWDSSCDMMRRKPAHDLHR